MDRESLERLRFDRRLKMRDGWVAASQEEEYLASLPDLTDQMTTCAAEEDAAEAERVELASSPELKPETSAPIAGDFSTSSSSSGTAKIEEPVTDALPDQGSAGTFASEGGFGSNVDSK
ncbi:MAG: hypothetical protein VCB25_11315 [Myxococcota bacterium]